MSVEIPTAVRCLLCGQRFAPDLRNPASEHPNGRFLICAAHGADDLTAAGLENIWIGSGNGSPDFRPGRGGSCLREVWLTPADQRGLFTIALRLDSDDLLVIAATYANLDVAWLRGDRVAAQPEGLVEISRAASGRKNDEAVARLLRARDEGWYLSWVQREWHGLALRFNRPEADAHLGVVAGERLGSLLIVAEALPTEVGPELYGLAPQWRAAPSF